MKNTYPFIFAFLLIWIIGSQKAFAQPSNDGCETPINITDVTDWCSNAGEFTNVDATLSGYGAPNCFSNASNDVWFTFTPISTDVTITIKGSTNLDPGGTLQRPEVALYTGTCGGMLNEGQCESDAAGNNIIELYKGGLAVGETYFIRVQGRNDNTGTFQLCINNYNPPTLPGSDCNTASLLCNKESFVVQQVTGAGNDPTESNVSSCLGGLGGNVESNSTWFSWTAATDGTFTFTLTPLNTSDDLDFMVYELPNGVLNCGDKIELRCMASGDLNWNSPCMGPTGLNTSSTDFSEPAGCDNPSQDNFLAALDMEAGKSYALMVNNWSGSGNGFKIDLGGTGELTGPQADFMADEPDLTVCVGEPITFTDISTFSFGQIVGWDWNFGSNASPALSNAKGPHEITYDMPGVKSIVLTVESEKGCIVTEIKNILVECCNEDINVNGIVTDLVCAGVPEGEIDINMASSFPPYSYVWSNGDNTEDVVGLAEGSYILTITDKATCDTVLSFVVNTPTLMELDTNITEPTCGGGTDGAIELLLSGGTPSYLYDWGSGFGNENVLSNISQGNYDVTVQDANACEEIYNIPVRELELILDPTVQAIVPPSCFGFSDGFIEVVISNGLPPYQFDWKDGNGYVSANSLNTIASGFYQVDVQDANLCFGHFEFPIDDPLPLVLDIQGVDVSCTGYADGSALAITSGGTGTYSYHWSDNQNEMEAINLKSGTHILTVTDENDCEIVENITIADQEILTAQVTDITHVGCFGDATGQINMGGIGGVPPYQYSLDGENFQNDPLFTNLPGGEYVLTLMDINGCNSETEAEIIQPEELIVDAGEDLTVDLGYNVDLHALVSPLFRQVTFQWLPPESLNCSDCADPIATPADNTTYTVMIVDETNCVAVDSITVRVFKNRPVYIPNAFSPDGDGINDYFILFGGPAAKTIKTLKIFSRWGSLVFEQNDISLGEEINGWDGTFKGQPLSPGVYAFVAEIEFIDDEVLLLEGDVTLMR